MTTSISQVTPEEWNDIRERFRVSMMVKTEVSKLAQNLDLSWPIKGRDEIPLKYLPLTHDEVLMMPGVGDHPERFRLLVEILRETMAFDDPFGEMAEHVDSSSKHDDGSQRVLHKLEIPLTYPLHLCALSPETREFCEAESVRTLGEFLDLAQNMAQNIVVGGDFRAFLNAVAHPEEDTIARFLPFRPGKRGLHLAEAIGQSLSLFSRSEKLFLLECAGAPVGAEDRRDTRILSDDEKSRVRHRVREHLTAIFAWFDGSREQLEDAFAEGNAQAERVFVPLDHAQTEKASVWMARLALGLDDPKVEKKGFFTRLFRR